MSSGYQELKDKIEMVFEWANDRSDFDQEFVESLYEQLEDRGTLSDKQEEALDNIIEKWGMDE